MANLLDQYADQQEKMEELVQYKILLFHTVQHMRWLTIEETVQYVCLFVPKKEWHNLSMQFLWLVEQLQCLKLLS